MIVEAVDTYGNTANSPLASLIDRHHASSTRRVLGTWAMPVTDDR